MRAMVIGAGPAGTATGLALQRAGWDVEISEAYGVSAGLTQGAFLTLAANGLDALEAIGAAGAVRDLGFPTRRIRFASGSGKDLGTMPMGLPDGEPPRTVLRSELHAALRDESLRRGIPVHHDRRLVGATPAGDRVSAVFADGTAETVDLLVGADGLRSKVRELIDPAARPPRPTGLANAGGVSPALPGLPTDRDYRMIWGRRSFFGYAVAPSGEAWWFANPPADTPRGLDALADLMEDDAGPAAQIIRATSGHLIFGDQLELPPVKLWHRAGMVLVGDAAHAVNPSTGQGASLAWEDAAVLGLELARHADPAAALAAYEHARRARVERVVKWGKRMGSSKAAGPVGRRVRDAMFPLVARLGSRESALRRQAWLHEHHIGDAA